MPSSRWTDPRYNGFPSAFFKTKAYFVLTLQDDIAFQATRSTIEWDERWCLKDSDKFVQLIVCALNPVGRFKYQMRKAAQLNNMAEGRVWPPLVLGHISTPLNTCCDNLLGDTVNLLEFMGAVAQFMDTPWLHRMRADIVFSSNTPRFVATLILCGSGRQYLICTPFRKLMNEVPAGFGGDVETCLKHPKDLGDNH